MGLAEQLHGIRPRSRRSFVDVDPRPWWALSDEAYEDFERTHDDTDRLFSAMRTTGDVVRGLCGELPRHPSMAYRYSYQGADQVVRGAAWVRNALARRLTTGAQLTGMLPSAESVADGPSPGGWYVHRIWNEHGDCHVLLSPEDPRLLRTGHQRRLCVHDSSRETARACTWWQAVLAVKDALGVPDPPD